jgi:hypothetical protein
MSVFAPSKGHKTTCRATALRLIHLQDSAEQDVCPSSAVIPMSELKRRVTDTAYARHEDHPHRRELRHHLCVMAGTTGHALRREAETCGAPFNRTLRFFRRVRGCSVSAGNERE